MDILNKMDSISTHTLARRVTNLCSIVHLYHTDFNPHPRTEGDFGNNVVGEAGKISTHTLARRVTHLQSKGHLGGHISTHTLARRVTE